MRLTPLLALTPAGLGTQPQSHLRPGSTISQDLLFINAGRVLHVRTVTRCVTSSIVSARRWYAAPGGRDAGVLHEHGVDGLQIDVRAFLLRHDGRV